MNKVITVEELPHIVQPLHEENKSIVLAGGCFDILHSGHLAFLAAAKKQGDVVVILLESDQSITARKGEGRPIHTQAIRAQILSAVSAIEYIVLLKPNMSNQEYDQVVLSIKPAIIATTKGDPGLEHKNRQALLCDASVSEVIERLPDHASSTLAKEITNV